jgi:RNA polymerase-binding transcription factor DksA
MPKSKTPHNDSLTPEFLKGQQEILEVGLRKCKERIRSLLEEFKFSTNFLREIPTDIIDCASSEEEGTKNAKELDQLRALIKWHEKALLLVKRALKGEKQNEEEYGKCLNCGGQIPEKRLKAVPWALLCVDCASAQETSGS